MAVWTDRAIFSLMPKGRQIEAKIIMTKEGETMEVTESIKDTRQGEVIAKLSGYGFIISGQEEFFFHKTALKDSFFAILKQGQKVEFVPDYENPKGLSAVEIYLID